MLSKQEQLEVIRRQLTQLSNSLDMESTSDKEIKEYIGACVIALNTLALGYKVNIALAVEAEKERLEALNRVELQKANDTLSCLSVPTVRTTGFTKLDSLGNPIRY